LSYPFDALPLTDPTSLGMLRLIAAQPQLSQREVASRLGVSLGKVNYCLRALMAKGLVKAENYRRSSNKLAYLYLLTPAGVAAKAELTRLFLARKIREYESLRVEIARLRSEANLSPNLRVANASLQPERRPRVAPRRRLASRPGTVEG
jgi:MarR family transcriptional regulator, temperature-dependent positive regulator of motility